MSKEAILHKHVKFWNHKGEVAVDGIDTLTPESAVYRAMEEYASLASQEHREEVERLKAREKELWIVLGEVLSEFDKTGTIPKGMYEEAKEIYKLPTPPTK